MSVGYKINILVLNFILENGLKYNLLTDPDFVHLLEIKKKTTKFNFKWNKNLDAFLSIKQLKMNILEWVLNPLSWFNFIFLFFINIFFINS